MNLSQQLAASNLTGPVMVRLPDGVESLDFAQHRHGVFPGVMSKTERMVRRASKLSKAQKALLHSNLIGLMLLVAAKEGALQDISRRQVEAFSGEHYQYAADMFWSQLQLFQAVAGYAAHKQIDTLEVLRDADGAWAQQWLKGVESLLSEPWKTNKTDYREKLRCITDALTTAESMFGRCGEVRSKNNLNPFCPNSEPEMHQLINFAWMIACWTPQAKRQPNYTKKQQKQVKVALQNYRKSLTNLTTYIDKGGEGGPFLFTRVRSDGQLCLIGPKNRLIPLDMQTTEKLGNRQPERVSLSS